MNNPKGKDLLSERFWENVTISLIKQKRSFVWLENTAGITPNLSRSSKAGGYCVRLSMALKIAKGLCSVEAKDELVCPSVGGKALQKVSHFRNKGGLHGSLRSWWTSCRHIRPRLRSLLCSHLVSVPGSKRESRPSSCLWWQTACMPPLQYRFPTRNGIWLLSAVP